ncbi:MAG: hypothetical protein M3Z04_00440, partial [Chloroflexota bacterium]|nr:hypothetical protein [Chloroflexota bacterium]
MTNSSGPSPSPSPAAASDAPMPMLAASAAGRMVGAILARVNGPHGGATTRPLNAGALWHQVGLRMGFAPLALTRPLLPVPSQAAYSYRPNLVWRARPVAPAPWEPEPEAPPAPTWPMFRPALGPAVQRTMTAPPVPVPTQLPAYNAPPPAAPSYSVAPAPLARPPASAPPTSYSPPSASYSAPPVPSASPTSYSAPSAAYSAPFASAGAAPAPAALPPQVVRWQQVQFQFTPPPAQGVPTAPQTAAPQVRRFVAAPPVAPAPPLWAQVQRQAVAMAAPPTSPPPAPAGFVAPITMATPVAAPRPAARPPAFTPAAP